MPTSLGATLRLDSIDQGVSRDTREPTLGRMLPIRLKRLDAPPREDPDILKNIFGRKLSAHGGRNPILHKREEIRCRLNEDCFQ